MGCLIHASGVEAVSLMISISAETRFSLMISEQKGAVRAL